MEMRSQDFDIVALFNQGLEEHNAGNLSAAKKMYHEILSIQPDHCEANHNIGIVLVAENKLDKALEFFKFAVTASPNVSLFWANYIDTLAKLERIVEAKALIKAAKNSGMSCENIEAVSHRLDTKNQEPLAKDTREIDEFITQQKFDDAVEACLNLLETYPSSGILNIILGKCYFELGQIDLAISSYTNATEYWPQSEVSYTMLGQIYSSQGDTEQAIKNLRKAVELKPNDHDLNLLLGGQLTQSGDFDAAVESLEQALKLKPDCAETYFSMGSALNAKGDLDGAIDSYKQAIKIKPDYAEAYNNMALVLNDLNYFDAAIENFKLALMIDPKSYSAYNNMGIALHDKGEPDAAIDSYQRAIKLKPDYADAYNNMGRSLNNKGDFDAAIDSYNKALQLKPDCAETHTNMGNSLTIRGDLDDAIKSFNNALKIKPDCGDAHFNKSTALLLLENFELGWAMYEWRWKTVLRSGQFLQSSKPVWNNEQKKSVFVWGEQGIGDQIMFGSLIPDMHASCSKLIVQTDKRLIPLFKRSFPDNVHSISNIEYISEEEYDAHIPIGSLPQYFRKTIDNFTKTSGSYLKADKSLSFSLRKTLLDNDSQIICGITWRGGNKKDSAAKHKSIELAKIAQVLSRKNVKLVNLQYGDTDQEVNDLRTKHNINIFNVSEVDTFNDLDGLAALICACDHVVSVDNLTVHLSGALGIKTSVLLPFSCDWRWGMTSKTSYWHSSISLYRQVKIFDWSDPLEELKKDFSY